MWFISMCLICFILIYETAAAQFSVMSSSWVQWCCGCSDLSSTKQMFLFSYLTQSSLDHTALDEKYNQSRFRFMISWWPISHKPGKSMCFKIVYCRLMGGGLETQSMSYKWRSEDNLQQSFLFFTMQVPGITLMLSGLVAELLSTEPSANTNLYGLKIKYVVTILHQQNTQVKIKNRFQMAGLSIFVIILS